MNKNVNICLVAGTHGDEYKLGAMVHQLVDEQAPNEVYKLIGNPLAVALDKRFVDYDLNRSFNGNSSGYEAERSQEIREMFDRENFTHVIDIHTSPSTETIAGILANGVYGNRTDQAINAFPDVVNIAKFPTTGVPHSVTGAFGNGGYALECPRYDEKKVAQNISKGILSLLSGIALQPIVRTMYLIDGYIPTSLVLPGGSVKDFEELPEIGGYAFVATELYKHQGYGHQGMRASERLEVTT